MCSAISVTSRRVTDTIALVSSEREAQAHDDVGFLDTFLGFVGKIGNFASVFTSVGSLVSSGLNMLQKPLTFKTGSEWMNTLKSSKGPLELLTNVGQVGTKMSNTLRDGISTYDKMKGKITQVYDSVKHFTLMNDDEYDRQISLLPFTDDPRVAMALQQHQAAQQHMQNTVVAQTEQHARAMTASMQSYSLRSAVYDLEHGNAVRHGMLHKQVADSLLHANSVFVAQAVNMYARSASLTTGVALTTPFHGSFTSSALSASLSDLVNQHNAVLAKQGPLTHLGPNVGIMLETKCVFNDLTLKDLRTGASGHRFMAFSDADSSSIPTDVHLLRAKRVKLQLEFVRFNETVDGNNFPLDDVIIRVAAGGVDTNIRLPGRAIIRLTVAHDERVLTTVLHLKLHNGALIGVTDDIDISGNDVHSDIIPTTTWSVSAVPLSRRVLGGDEWHVSRLTIHVIDGTARVK